MGFVRGAAAGFAATVPMTVAMEGLRAWLPRERVRKMPPREVVDRTVAETGEAHRLDEADRVLITTAAHFAFGAAAGAAYGAMFDSRQSRGLSTLTGIGYGLAVWALAYAVALPALGLHPAAADDTNDRNEVLIASHVVWGTFLGIFAGTLGAPRGVPARSAKRD
jgi:uncharacterized membrane protein YagU involved in acid resistance